MKTYLKIAGYFIFFIFVAALVTPLLFNPNSYKSKIVAQMEKSLARKVTIDGDIKLRLLPLPRVKIKDIKIESIPGAHEPSFAEVGALDIHVQLWPLFRGHVAVDKIKLDRVRLVLEELPSKKTSWELPLLASEPSKPVTAVQENTGSSIFSFDIRRVEINHGEVIYLTTQSRQDIKDINLEVNLSSLKGPYNLDGNFEYLSHKLYLNGKVDQLADVIPAEINLDVFGQQVNLIGKVDIVKKSIDSTIKVKGHTKDLLKLVPALKNTDIPLQEYKIKSTVNITPNQVSSKSIELVYGNINAVGYATIDLNTLNINAQLKVNPGQAAFVLTSQPKPNTLFNGSFSFEAQDLAVLLNVLKVQSVSLPKELTKSFKVAADITYGKDYLTLSKIVFSQGNAKLEGMFSQKKMNNQPLYQYELKTSDLLPLAKIFMPDFSFNLGATALKGEITGPLNALKTQTHLMTAHSHIAIQGDINVNDSNQVAYNIDLTLQGANLKSMLTDLNVDIGQKNIGKFKIATTLKGDLSHIVAQNLVGEISVNNSLLNWKGSVEATKSPLRPKISATLSFGNINLDSLFAEAPQNYWDLLDKAQIMVVANKKVLPKHSTRWSHEKIDLSFLKSFDGDFKLSSSKVELSSFVFQNLEGRVKIINGILEIPQMTAQTFGGNVSLKGRASSQQGQPVHLKVNMTGANLKEVAPQDGKITIASGTLNLNVDLNSVGSSEFEYIKNLSGSMTLNALNGAINGFNLKKMSEQLGKTHNVGSLFKLLNATFEGGKTPFTSFDGALSINEGIARITSMNLIAEGATGQATGKINLPAYTLNVGSTIKLSETKFPSFGVRFFGSLDAPQHELDVAELQQYLVQNVFKGVIDGVLKNKSKPINIVKDILGVGSQEKPVDGQQVPQQPSESPKDIVKNPAKAIDTLIKGLF